MFYCGDCGQAFDEKGRRTPCCKGTTGVLAQDELLGGIDLETKPKPGKPFMPRQPRSDDRTRNPWRPVVGDNDAAMLVVIKRGEEPRVAMMKGPTDLLHKTLARMQPPKPRGRRGNKKKAQSDG